jgi:polyisoprenoid-binding protein YceI
MNQQLGSQVVPLLAQGPRWRGTVRIAEGQIQIEDNTITGVAETDMNSIENINMGRDELQPVLVSHLKSEDLFLVKAFPTAKFIISNLNFKRSCVKYDWS